MGAGGRAGLTVVGQVVGSYFGPIGSAIGGMIGSAIGAAIWPEQIEGPKLGEFQMMTSTYGAAIPLIWGGMRVGGNVFWCSPIREVEVTEEQGKGGGAELTYKKRYADIAVGLCSGEIIGIRKLWMNQKLVYDLGDAADIATIYASFSKGGDGMRFYPGSQTQLPDALIEAVKGIGATPAYRGLAYIVFENIELGTSFPNITAEVIKGGTTLGPRRLFDLDLGITVNELRILGVGAELMMRNEIPSIASGTSIGLGYISTPAGDNLQIAALNALPALPPNAPGAAHWWATLLLATAEHMVYTVVLPASTSPAQIALTQIGTFVDSDLTVEHDLTDGGNYIATIIPAADGRHVLALYALASAAAAPTYWVLWSFENGGFVEERRGTVDAGAKFTRAGGSMRGAYISSNGEVFCFYAGMLESDLRHAWWSQTAIAHATYLCEIGDDDVLRFVEEFANTPQPTDFKTVCVYADNACCWVTADGNLYGYTRSPSPAIDVTLDEVVEDICLLAGLSADQIDVTALADIQVNGYVLKQLASARAAIEPLMIAYAFDAVESDDVIKFVRRAATPAITIGQDDLGAGQGAAAEALVSTTRTQESELPVQITVSYVAPHADYQVGTQSVTRGTTESNNKQQIQMALALSDEEAIEIAYRMMYELWTARNQRAWATTVKYAAYEPTDVIDLEVA